MITASLRAAACSPHNWPGGRGAARGVPPCVSARQLGPVPWIPHTAQTSHLQWGWDGVTVVLMKVYLHCIQMGMILLLNRKKVNKINVIYKRHENWTFGAKRLFIYLLIASFYPLQSTIHMNAISPPLAAQPCAALSSTQCNRLRWPRRWQGIVRRWGPRNNNRIDLWRYQRHESLHWARLARWPPCSSHSVAPLPNILANLDSLLNNRGRNK